MFNNNKQKIAMSLFKTMLPQNEINALNEKTDEQKKREYLRSKRKKRNRLISLSRKKNRWKR